MISWFLSLFGLRKEIPKTHSVEEYEPLTPWELQFLIAHDGQTCPDCETGQLWFLAEGGGTMQIECGKCKAKLGVRDQCESPSIPYGGHRIRPGVKIPNPNTYRG
jgi:hypothetical protein